MDRIKSVSVRRVAWGAFLMLMLVTVLDIAARRDYVPENFETLDVVPEIYPDYVDATLPPNIAPANFRIEVDAEDYATRLTTPNGRELCVAGREVCFPLKKWKYALQDAKGGKIACDVFVKKEGKWRKFKTFDYSISNDPIDPMIAYRLIEPGYEFGHRIVLAQRSLESFQEDVFADNRTTATSPCVNCHSFQNYKTNRFLFHYRSNGNAIKGGTILVDGKKIRKVTAEFEKKGATCSYPAWRPTGDLVAFSVNQTRQYFHSLSTQKLEVFDVTSDLVVFDFEKNELIPVLDTPDDFETFPGWSPDGRSLYYSCAKVKLEKPVSDFENRADEAGNKTDEFHYSIMKMDFDETTKTFGEPKIVVDANDEKSALFARVSPDGNYLAYVVAKSGAFPIWRPEADLFIKDLRSGKERPWDELNSDNTESYHTWSSSGRWIVFSSRREDGQFTRLYFAHVDEQGRASKPFVLPQKNPNANRYRFKSYNIPEFILEPVKLDSRELLNTFESEPVVTTNR